MPVQTFLGNVIFAIVLTLTWTSQNSYGQHAPLRGGVELDVLPFATGGYFGAAWIGKGKVRGRALVARVNMPDFIVPKGFTNNQISSVALVMDYFLTEDWQGWWFGGGVVKWNGRIQLDQQPETARYRSYLINGSVGYSFRLGNRFYVSPWAGMSVRVGGTKQIAIDNIRFNPPVFNPELSVKVGWIIF